MKALILSGGKGTRLRPITHTSAKQLVPVANKPILFYTIEAVVAAGVREVGIVVGDTHQEIRDSCGDGSRWGCRITYIQQDAPLGLAHAVKIAEDFIAGEPFVMYLGDNLIRDGIINLAEEFEREKPNAQILLAHVPNPTEFGVAELEGNRVVRLVEKPKEPKTDLALVGVYMFDRTVFEAVNSIKPSWRGELEITDAIQYLVDTGRTVHSHIIGGWWKDTGKREDMLEANRLMLEDLEPSLGGQIDDASVIHGRVVVGDGSEIVRSTIRGPVIIGANCKITDAYIGPFTSINDNAVVTNSEIEHSIILEDCCIENLEARMEDSLLGRNVRVCRDDSKPRAYRFMLGESSDVSVL
ncbi:MAG: glucose-1-phosphate thymidylyltransferase [Armatimonadetes bacterium]|nr:glucose-1-phosphate thymidylyltransferase [Armatimonadota bacterium]